MMPYPKNRYKRYAACCAVCLLTLLILSPFAATWVINTDYVKKKLSAVISQKTGLTIPGSSFSLSIFPKPGLIINNFKLKPDDQIDITTGTLKFNIDAQELLHGSISIRQIFIDRPNIQTRFSAKKNFDPPDGLSIPESIQWLKRIFDFLPDHQASVKLIFQNGISQYFEQMNGSLYLSKEKKEIILNATIKKIKIRPASLPGLSLEKYLDLDTIGLDQLEIFSTLTSKGELKGRLKLTAPKLKSNNNHIIFDADRIESLFSLSDNFYQIDINPFKSNYPKGMVGVSFSNDPAQKKAMIQFSGTDIHIDQARKMALVLFKGNNLAENLFQILQSGVAPKVDVAFQSQTIEDLFHGNHLTLSGNIKNGTVSIPKTNLTASQVSGQARIRNGVLDIRADKAMTRTSKILEGKLSVDLLNYDDTPFQGSFSLDVDLSMVPQTLISLLPETLLAQELSLVRDIKGQAMVELGLSMKTNTDDLKVTVSTADFTVAGRYDRVPGEILLENVNFTYKPDTVTLSRLTGTINNSKIDDLNTVIDFNNEPLLHIQSGSGEIYLTDMIPWLMSHEKTKNLVSPVKEGSGFVRVSSIDLSGPLLKPRKWSYDVKGAGTGINVATHLNQREIEDLSCRFRLSDALINLEDIQAKISSLSWLEHVIEKKHLESLLVPLDIENGQFTIKKKAAFFTSDLNFGSGPKMQMELKGPALESLELQSLELIDKGFSNASVSFYHNKKKPLFNFNGILNTATLNKLVIPGSYWSKKINDLTEGQPVLIHTDKTSALNIAIKSMNLNSILSSSKTFSSGSRLLLPDNPIHFKADQLKIKKLTLTNIASDLSFKKDQSYIKINTAFLCDLKANGFINFEKGRIHADLPFGAENKPNIQNLLTCLFQKKDLMDGRYSLTGTIQSDSSGKEYLNKLTGSLALNATEGRIYKWTLLSRILSVLNVSKFFKGKLPNVIQKGFAYKNISIEADIKDSVIHLTRAIIDGNDMTLIFNGWIDPINDKIDLICLVAPFKTVDLIIEKIPIINTLLDGRLVSIPIKATGRLSDPAVIPLHPSAVGSGLINMMSTILKAPVKLLDKMNSD